MGRPFLLIARKDFPREKIDPTFFLRARIFALCTLLTLGGQIFARTDPLFS
jgi:hypothetical protein